MATNELTPAEQAQQLYVSYYGRPGDPGGFAFWVEEFTNSDNVDAVLVAFGESDETARLLESEGVTDTTGLVTLLYNQMFNRDPDAEGLAFYVEEIDSGRLSAASAALDIANGAQNEDRVTLDNKIEVANTFTASLEDENGYTGVDAETDGRALLSVVDETDESVTAGNAAAEELATEYNESTGPEPGEEYVLTPGADVIESGAGDDTILGVTTGAAATTTVQAGDLIADSSVTDNDVFTINAQAAVPALTVSGIETIEVNLDLFGGATAAVDAKNITGANIVLDSVKLGFDGAGKVDNIGNNSVTMGEAVNNLDANGVKDASITAGANSTVAVDIVADPTDLVGPTLSFNGDSKLTLSETGAGSAKIVNIEALEDATITLTDGTTATLVAMGDKELNITGVWNGKTVQDKIGENGSLNLVNTGTGATDLTKIASAANIALAAPVAAAGAATVKMADGQTVALLVDQGGAGTATFEGISATSGTGTIVVADDLTSKISVTKMASVGLTIVDAKNTIADLTATASQVSLTAVGDVKITTTDAPVVNGAAVAGDLTITTTAANSTVVAGEGDDTFTATANHASSFNGGGGDDVAIFGAPDGTAADFSGTLAASLGDGDDRVIWAPQPGKGAVASTNLAIDGGAGTDTLLLVDLSGAGTLLDFSLGSLTMAATEVVAFGVAATINPNAPDNAKETIKAHLPAASLNGGTQIITAADSSLNGGLGVDVVELTLSDAVGVDALDFSGLTVLDARHTSFTINGKDGSAQAITGTSGNDTIDAGKGKAGTKEGSTLTGGTGSDTFKFDLKDTTATTVASVTDYTSATAPGLFNIADTVQFKSTGGGVKITGTDTGNAVTIDTAAKTPTDATKFAYTETAKIFASASQTVNVIISNGVLKLSGLTADVALADTLEEMITIVGEVTAGAVGGATDDLLAFEFDGNTYVYENSGGTAPTGEAAAVAATLENIVELTGTTGVTLVTDQNAINGPDTVFVSLF